MADALKAKASDGTGTNLSEVARTVFRWWLEELRACMFLTLKARGRTAPAAFCCVLLQDGRMVVAPLDRAHPALPPEHEATQPSDDLADRVKAMVPRSGARSVRLAVPVSLCLVRRTRIPARALSLAGDLLRHEIEMLLPLEPGEILSDWYVETEDQDALELNIVQVVLARPHVAAAERLLVAAGLSITQISVGEAEGRAMPIDLLAKRNPSLRGYLTALPRTAKLMLATATLIFAAVPFVVASSQGTVLAAIAEMRTAALRSGPTGLSAQAVADALEAFDRRAKASSLLDDIASRLPAGASLSHFQLGDGQVILSVNGAEDTAVPTALSGMAGVLSVESVKGSQGTIILTLSAPGLSSAVDVDGATP